MSITSCLVKALYFSMTVNSHKQILGRSQDALVGKVREAQLKLPPTKIARDGSIMEWVRQYFLFPYLRTL